MTPPTEDMSGNEIPEQEVAIVKFGHRGRGAATFGPGRIAADSGSTTSDREATKVGELSELLVSLLSHLRNRIWGQLPDHSRKMADEIVTLRVTKLCSAFLNMSRQKMSLGEGLKTIDTLALALATEGLERDAA